MKRIKINSIKSQIAICFLFMFILLVVVLCYYYINLRRSSQEQSELMFEQYSNEMLQQISERLNTIEQVAKSTGYYSVIQKMLFSNSSNEKVQNLRSARELLATNRSSYPFITDIFLYTDTPSHLYSNTDYVTEFKSSLKYYGLEDDITLDESFLSNIHSGEYSSPLFFHYLPISNIIYDGTFIAKQNDAICVFLCDMKSLYYIPEELEDEEVTLALVHNDNLICVSHDITPEYAAQLLTLTGEERSFSYDETEYYAGVAYGEDNVRVVCSIPVSAIDIYNHYKQNILYMILFLGTFFIITMLYYSAQRISMSVKTILKGLGSIKLSDDNIRLEEPKLEEFLILTKQINIMLDYMESSIKEEKAAREKLYQANIQQQRAEMIAYRNQINPHFLFNTLECMRSMAQYYHAEPIEQLVTAMSKLFRYSLYAEGVVALTQEIDHVCQYMTVTDIRFPDMYKIKLLVDEDAQCFHIPSMLLQPLVENSVKHAFNSTKKKQHIIQLRAWVDAASLLHIRIIDNGCGMTDDELNLLRQQNHSNDDEMKQSAKDSIGIKNIYKRIKLFNTENKIRFSSKYGFYTRIDLLLYPMTGTVEEQLKI